MAKRLLDSLAIVVMCVLVAMFYGVLHDQITARICIEYFTVGHPSILPFATQSATLLGLVWGVVATWWVGALLGIPLALATQFGRRPVRPIKTLWRPIALLVVGTACFAAAAGLCGNQLAASGIVILLEPLASQVPEDKHVSFITNSAAHTASYLVGSIGAMIVIWRAWRSRRPTNFKVVS